MRYFINANIARHFTHTLFKNWILLPVYFSSLNSRYLDSIIIQNPYIQFCISSGLYLYHNLPILQIHMAIRSAVPIPIQICDHSWLYQLVWTSQLVVVIIAFRTYLGKSAHACHVPN